MKVWDLPGQQPREKPREKPQVTVEPRRDTAFEIELSDEFGKLKQAHRNTEAVVDMMGEELEDVREMNNRVMDKTARLGGGVPPGEIPQDIGHPPVESPEAPSQPPRFARGIPAQWAYPVQLASQMLAGVINYIWISLSGSSISDAGTLQLAFLLQFLVWFVVTTTLNFAKSHNLWPPQGQ